MDHRCRDRVPDCGKDGATAARADRAAGVVTLPALCVVVLSAVLSETPAMAQQDISVSPAPPYLDFSPEQTSDAAGNETWTWQWVPDHTIYPSYLAGVKEPRFASTVNYDKTFGWTWDSVLGARVPVLRYGTEGSPRPDGVELGIEGAAFPRLDLEHDRDLESVDFRFGVPLTFGLGSFQSKLAFYHSCSHLGDQYMLLYPNLERVNYSRDAIVWGNSYYLGDDLRIYGEASWGFYVWGAAQPWEFQFGAEYSAAKAAADPCGSPFAAINADLREDVGYNGNLVVQTGWQWRGRSGHLFRLGVQYFNGKSEQFQFLNRNEEKIGIAAWYDF
jgi:hypothetical protein